MLKTFARFRTGTSGPTRNVDELGKKSSKKHLMMKHMLNQSKIHQKHQRKRISKSRTNDSSKDMWYELQEELKRIKKTASQKTLFRIYTEKINPRLKSRDMRNRKGT